MEVLDNFASSKESRVRTIQEVLNEGYRFEFGLAFNRIFKYLADTWALCLAHAAINGVVYYIGSLIVFFSFMGFMDFESMDNGEIPDVQDIVSKVITVYAIIGAYVLLIVWPLRAGHWIHFHRFYVDGKGSFGDFFGVFGRKYIKFVALSLLAFILIGIWTAVPAWWFITDMFESVAEMERSNIPALPDFSMFGWMMLGYIPAIFFMVSLSLSFILLLFHTDDVLEAISASIKIMWKRWFLFFALFLVMYIMAIAGIIALCIGILVTNFFLPWATFAIYEQIFIQEGPAKKDF